MTELQIIREKKVWIKVDPWHVHRDNPNIIPTEYFIVSYYLQEPETGATNGKIINDDNDEPKLFESPVAALNYAQKILKEIL